MDLRLLRLTDGHGIAADGVLMSMGGISVTQQQCGLQMLKDLVAPTHAIEERRGHRKNKKKKGNWKQKIRGRAEHPR